MRNPYQRKSSTSLVSPIIPPIEQYRIFIETIIEQEKAYGLYNDGWALCGTPSGHQTLPIWQSKHAAQLLLKDKWASYDVQEITIVEFVDDVIPYLRKQNTQLSLNLLPEGQNILVSGHKMLMDLKGYLYQLSIQDPLIFQRKSLPHPRKIRLNH